MVAQRIARYANLVGRDNVIAGSDCGFGTWVGQAAVNSDVVWAKQATTRATALRPKPFLGRDRFVGRVAYFAGVLRNRPRQYRRALFQYS